MAEQLAELRRMKREHRPENLLREVIERAEARAVAALGPEVNITSLPAQSAGLREAATALAQLESRPSAPIEHPDREQIDHEYEEIARASERPVYDEEEDARLTLERWTRLENTPRAKWTSEDREFFELAAMLPEIRQLTRRSA